MMKKVHQIEQRLADDFENAEIHDLGFVVLELRKPVIKFRTGVELETRGRTLTRLQRESWHPHRSFNRRKWGRIQRLRNFETASPNCVRLAIERGKQGREKL